MRKLLFLIAFTLLSTSAFANGSILVTEPGDDGLTIKTSVFNNSSYDIIKLNFDFTSTRTTDGSYIVIDDTPYEMTGPFGGTAVFSGSGSIFDFTFTSFNTSDSFNFEWDPDSAIDGVYGATGLDFVGAKVIAETTGGIYFGTFLQAGNTLAVTATLSPVPEPSRVALFVCGLILLLFPKLSLSKGVRTYGSQRD